MGTERTYIADFLINGKILVEIKSARLFLFSFCPSVKQKAAKKFCKNNGLKYKFVDTKTFSPDAISKLYYDNKIKFSHNYEKKFWINTLDKR